MGSVVLHREFGSVFKKEAEITLTYHFPINIYHHLISKVFAWCVLKPFLNGDNVFFFSLGQFFFFLSLELSCCVLLHHCNFLILSTVKS